MSRGRQRTIWTALLSGKQHTGHTIDPTDRQTEGRDHSSHSDDGSSNGNGILACNDESILC